MTFSNIKQIVVPEGAVKKITYNGATLWERISRYLKTVIGKVVTVTDALNEPAESLVVTFNPKQDLHGYDKPWAGGAGKNVLPYQQNGASNLGITLTYDEDAEAYVLNGTTTAQGNIILSNVPNINWTVGEQYTISAEKVSGEMILGSGSGITFAIALFSSNYSSYLRGGVNQTDFNNYSGYGNAFEASNSKLLIQLWREGTVFNNFKFRIQIEKGNTKTSWVPYENICPISGHTECVTQRTGVNVWDEEWELGSYGTADGEPATYTDRIRGKNRISVVPNTEYFFKTSNGLTAGNMYFYDVNDEFILAKTTRGNNVTVTPDNCRYMRISMGLPYGATYNHDISINYPSTDHDYHAYNGHTYTTALGRTVYGGTLDVVSGVLTVDRAMVDLGTLTWTDQSSATQKSYYSPVINNIKKPASVVLLSGALCAIYKEVMSYGFIANGGDNVFCISQTGRINVNDNDYATASAFKTAMSGVQLCYELATPQTYQLTRQQINMFKYNNNFMANENDISLTYWGTEQSN